VGTVKLTIDPVSEYLMLIDPWFDKLLTYKYSTNRWARSFDSALMMIRIVLPMVIMIVERR
jgi:hypothetical protein